MRKPAAAALPQLKTATLRWRQCEIALPFFHRAGKAGPTVLFVHGLGGAKENFYAALQSEAMAHCTVFMFDEPGTGLAPYYPECGLDVSALADLTHSFAEEVIGERYWLAGASMGGLISILMVRKFGVSRLLGMINLEGNLCPEDCMFSRRVVPHTLESFAPIYEQMIGELRHSRFAGDQIIAQNMALNVDARAYHAYSFETVRESDTGTLFGEFVRVPLPKLFLYGEQNRVLSYLGRLRDSDVTVQEISASGHFLFLDNPVETYQTIAEFINSN